MTIWAIVFALLLGICIFVALPRGKAWQRAGAVAAYFLLIGVAFGGSADLLGRPKPMRLEWQAADEATVLAASLREGEAIFVWLQMGTAPSPRAYALPWSVAVAQKLQEAMEEGRTRGSEVQMWLPPSFGGDAGEPRIYALPQTPLPEKAYRGGVETVVHRPPGS
jgi:hypothetical protein